MPPRVWATWGGAYLSVNHTWTQGQNRRGGCKGRKPECLTSRHRSSYPGLWHLVLSCSRDALPVPRVRALWDPHRGLRAWTHRKGCHMDGSSGHALGSAATPALLSQDWLKGQGSLQPEDCNSRQIAPSTASHSPQGASEMLISAAPQGPHSHKRWRNSTLREHRDPNRAQLGPVGRRFST